MIAMPQTNEKLENEATLLIRFSNLA